MAEPMGQGQMGMMAPPPEMDMGNEAAPENPLTPEETQEVQSLVDSSPALVKFIDAIASIDPMEFGINLSGGNTQTPPQPPVM